MKWPALLLLSGCAFAATTATWEMTGYQDFLHGRINGLSLTRDGRLMLGSKLDTVFDSGSRKSGASRRRRMDRCIWARGIAGGFTKWTRRGRARWCGRRTSRRFSR